MAGEKILVLGAGLVSRPGVEYLAKAGYNITIASRTGERAQKVIEGLPNSTAVELDAADPTKEQELSDMIAACDIVVSLLPWTMHTPIAKLAVKHKVHFGSTSYISEEMEKLDAAFKENGKCSINEVGVDPGLDHMSAKKIIDHVHSEGGKIKSFLSYCGGLPCPDDNDNPFGYKFSWSPKGVLLAAVRKAAYIQDGEHKFLDATPGKEIYENYLIDSGVPDVGEKLEKGWPKAFESHPNGDSIKFQSIYGIPECEELIRGTYRNVGWCATMKKIKDLGLLGDEDVEAKISGKSFAQVVAEMLGCDVDSVKEATAKKLDLATDDEIIKRMEWLGLFSKDNDASAKTMIDATSKLFQENPKFSYAEGERDMICMHHTFLVEKADGKKEKITSTLIDYGIKNGDTSMARTVTLPMAIAIKGVLSGKFDCTGVVRPVDPSIYEPILAEMESLGFKFIEKTEAL